MNAFDELLVRIKAAKASGHTDPATVDGFRLEALALIAQGMREVSV